MCDLVTYILTRTVGDILCTAAVHTHPIRVHDRQPTDTEESLRDLVIPSNKSSTQRQREREKERQREILFYCVSQEEGDSFVQEEVFQVSHFVVVVVVVVVVVGGFR